MPIYEYLCKECNARFEKIVFGTTPEVDCPSCGSKDTEKLLSTFAVSGGGTGSSKQPSTPPCGRSGFS